MRVMIYNLTRPTPAAPRRCLFPNLPARAPFGCFATDYPGRALFPGQLSVFTVASSDFGSLTFKVCAPGTIRLISPVRTVPGPTSTKVITPN